MRDAKLMRKAFVALSLAALAGLPWLQPPAAPGAIPGCRVLPNGVVPLLASWSPGCALEAYDRVVALRLEPGEPATVRVVRAGREETLRVPAMPMTRVQKAQRIAAALFLAALLGATTAWIRRSSTVRASRPFLALCLCTGVVAWTALCGAFLPALETAGVIARGAIPAILVHLALVFPRERGVLRRAPRLVAVSYGVAALMIAIALVNLDRSPAVFVLVDRLWALVSLAIWGLIVIGCALARLESRSLLERARARALLWGAGLVPGLAAATLVATGARPSSWALIAALPIPLGYALAHRRIFDLGTDLRRFCAWLVHAGFAAVFLLGAAQLARHLPGGFAPEDPASFFGAAFFGFLVGEPLRARLRRAITARVSPGPSRLVESAHDHAALTGELRDPDECADLLCRFARRGLDAAGVSVFLAVDGEWRLACASGKEAATSLRAAAQAARVCREAALVHLAREDPRRDPAARGLQRAGVEVVASLRNRGSILGLLLVGAQRRGEAYASPDLDYLDSIVRQAAISVQNAKLTGGLLEAGRAEALERVGVGLAHDLGKPLGVVECLAARLPDEMDDPVRLARDAKTISLLAGEMRSMIRRSADLRLDPAPPRLDGILERAVRSVALTHGPGRVSLRLPPELPYFSGPAEMLARVLANLLDNAVRASGDDEVVELVVSRVGDRLDFEVIDRGSGMTRAVASRAFEPFFTTRPFGEGTGLGLSICRDLVEAMGGDVSLLSSPAVGTRARVRIPGAQDEDDHVA